MLKLITCCEKAIHAVNAVLWRVDSCVTNDYYTRGRPSCQFQIEGSANTDELQAALRDESVLNKVVGCGLTKPIHTITSDAKKELANLQHVLLRPKSAIEQFLEGLNEVCV